jgi:acetyl-CoA carboxylase/biotin carboxylase 1
LDSTINPDRMEMYAQEDSRGSVIEPEGIIEIKFRTPKLLEAMERTDPIYKALKLELASNRTVEGHAAVLKRQTELLPIYVQVKSSLNIGSYSFC